MSGRAATEADDGDSPVVAKPAKRGREDAIVWARGLVAKGIRVVRLRSSKRGGAPLREPSALTDRRR